MRTTTTHTHQYTDDFQQLLQAKKQNMLFLLSFEFLATGTMRLSRSFCLCKIRLIQYFNWQQRSQGNVIRGQFGQTSYTVYIRLFRDMTALVLFINPVNNNNTLLSQDNSSYQGTYRHYYNVQSDDPAWKKILVFKTCLNEKSCLKDVLNIAVTFHFSPLLAFERIFYFSITLCLSNRCSLLTAFTY